MCQNCFTKGNTHTTSDCLNESMGSKGHLRRDAVCWFWSKNTCSHVSERNGKSPDRTAEMMK